MLLQSSGRYEMSGNLLDMEWENRELDRTMEGSGAKKCR